MAKAKVKITWHDKAVQRDVRRTLRSRLPAVGEMLRAAVVRAVNESTRAQGPSLPGHPPHKDTGKLQQSYFSRFDGDREVVVGSPLEYARYLEKGTRKMAPRPVLVPALFRNRRTIAKMLGVPNKSLRINVTG